MCGTTWRISHQHCSNHLLASWQSCQLLQKKRAARPRPIVFCASVFLGQRQRDRTLQSIAPEHSLPSPRLHTRSCCELIEAVGELQSTGSKRIASPRLTRTGRLFAKPAVPWMFCSTPTSDRAARWSSRVTFQAMLALHRRRYGSGVSAPNQPVARPPPAGSSAAGGCGWRAGVRRRSRWAGRGPCRRRASRALLGAARIAAGAVQGRTCSGHRPAGAGSSQPHPAIVLLGSEAAAMIRAAAGRGLTSRGSPRAPGCASRRARRPGRSRPHAGTRGYAVHRAECGARPHPLPRRRTPRRRCARRASESGDRADLLRQRQCDSPGPMRPRHRPRSLYHEPRAQRRAASRPPAVRCAEQVRRKDSSVIRVGSGQPGPGASGPGGERLEAQWGLLASRPSGSCEERRNCQHHRDGCAPAGRLRQIVLGRHPARERAGR